MEALIRLLQELEELTPPGRLGVLQCGLKLHTHRKRRCVQHQSPPALRVGWDLLSDLGGVVIRYVSLLYHARITSRI